MANRKRFIKNTNHAKKKIKRRNSRSINHPRLPPAKGLMANVFRSIVQTAWDITQGSLQSLCNKYSVASSDNHKVVSVNADFGYLLAQGWRAKYSALFREAKIHKVETWYLPYASITEPGMYVFNLSDYNENKLIKTVGLSNIGAPGTIVRKMNEISYRVWYPTEPSDKEWQVINGSHTFLSYVLTTVEQGYYIHGDARSDTIVNTSLAGKIIVNVDASFRGQGGRPPREMEPCFCNKCFRIRAKLEYNKTLTNNVSIIKHFQELLLPEESV